VKKASRVLGLVILAIALVMVAGPAAQGADDKVMKIGICMPLAGPVGAWGRPIADGIILLADEYNQKGGINIGGEMYKIEVREADTGMTAEGATASARRLLEQDKVDWIVGAMATFTTLSMQEVTEPAKILTLNTSSNIETMVKSDGKDYSFRGWMPYSEIVPAALRWLHRTHPEIKRVALFEVNLDSVWAGHRLLVEFIPEVGMEIVYNEFYEWGTDDFMPYMVKILSAKPDLIYMASGLPQYLALTIKAARDMGYKGRFMAQTMADLSVMGPIAGMKNLEGLYTTGYPETAPYASAEELAWQKKFQDKYKSTFQFSLWTTPPASAILQAYEEAGTMDVNKVIPLLEDGRIWKTACGVDGIFGNTQRYGQPHQWMAPQVIFEVKNGELIPIAEIPVEDMYYAWQGKD